MSTLELKELSHPSGEVIKIASGKTLDLNSQGSVTMPSGSVIQVATVMPNVGDVTLATASWTEPSNLLRISFTPKYATSTLIIECCFMYGGGNSSNISHFKLYDITNSADIELSGYANRLGVHGSSRHVDVDLNDCDNMNLQVVTTASNTTARTYGMFSRNESGTVAKYFFANPTNSSELGNAKPILKITEVAG